MCVKSFKLFCLAPLHISGSPVPASPAIDIPGDGTGGEAIGRNAGSCKSEIVSEGEDRDFAGRGEEE